MEHGYATSPPMEVCLRPPKVNASRPGLVQALGADSVSGPCLYLNAAGTIPVPCFAHARRHRVLPSPNACTSGPPETASLQRID